VPGSPAATSCSHAYPNVTAPVDAMALHPAGGVMTRLESSSIEMIARSPTCAAAGIVSVKLERETFVPAPLAKGRYAIAICYPTKPNSPSRLLTVGTPLRGKTVNWSRLACPPGIGAVSVTPGCVIPI
jgi:hypothetical protein